VGIVGRLVARVIDIDLLVNKLLHVDSLVVSGYLGEKLGNGECYVFFLESIRFSVFGVEVDLINHVFDHLLYQERKDIADFVIDHVSIAAHFSAHFLYFYFVEDRVVLLGRLVSVLVLVLSGLRCHLHLLLMHFLKFILLELAERNHELLIAVTRGGAFLLDRGPRPLVRRMVFVWLEVGRCLAARMFLHRISV